MVAYFTNVFQRLINLALDNRIRIYYDGAGGPSRLLPTALTFVAVDDPDFVPPIREPFDLDAFNCDYIEQTANLTDDLDINGDGWYESEGDWALVVGDITYVWNGRDPRTTFLNLLGLPVH